MMEIDSKRTGIRAKEIYEIPPIDDAAKCCGEPGSVLRHRNESGLTSQFSFCCPGCGSLCAVGIRNGRADWQVTGGSEEDVTTLSLSPSILNYCCGWHGYLRNGVFESV